MTLSTLINAGLTRPDKPRTALVLMGGGARTAYQAGVLSALADMLRLQGPSAIALGTQAMPSPPASASGAGQAFPFQILVGTSAGALNASFLASRATDGLAALDALAQFWRALRSHHVYQLDISPWVRLSKIAAAWSLSKQIRGHGAMLNNMPLVDTLHKSISLGGIDAALDSQALHALAVTASSYSSGVHWTFCHTRRDARHDAWMRPGRRAEFGPVTIEHLMASSAIPLIFPSTPLWVDGGREFFGDGSMRQTSPLSPAMHLGAHKVLCIGVGQPQRSSFGGGSGTGNHSKAQAPSLGGILGHAMASVFHDTLHSDVEQAQRMNHTLGQLPREVAAVMPYRSINVMSLQPSESLDDLALRHVGELPDSARNALAGLGAFGPAGRNGSSEGGSAGSAGSAGGSAGSAGAAALTSYLLFEPGFVTALIAMGQRDAYAQKTQLMKFFSA
jgi:NTE family protein